MKTTTIKEFMEFNVPERNIHIDVSIQHGRELTQEEKSEIANYLYDFKRKVVYNTIKNDPNSIKTIEEEKEKILNCFSEVFNIEEIDNQYSNGSILPWYKIYTRKGEFTVGWRKRVIHLGWENSFVKASAAELFPDEDVTKGTYCIHCWGFDKLKEYLDKLHK